MSKILLIAATTGYQTRSFLLAAGQLNTVVTLATDRCDVLEDPWGDGAIAVRFDEPRQSAVALADVMRERGIDSIAAVGDRTTLLAALTAERAGIPWHPPAAALHSRDKHLMRERFGAAGLLVPAFSNDSHLPYPRVVKPLHLSASRGVIRVDNDAEFHLAVKRIRAMLSDPSAVLQIETYIPGREFALEGVMNHGELIPLALFDKPDPLTGPFFEETIYVTPSREPAEIQRSIVENTRRAVHSLGLWHGPIHAEMRVNEAGIWMLEIAARPIGGLCSRALQFRAAGFPSINLEQLVILHATGRMPAELAPATPASGVMMIPVPRQGIFRAVSGLDAARAVGGIDDIVITVKPGEKLIPLPEGAAYPGFIFATGPDPAFVEAALRDAHHLLRFEILPDLPVIA